MARVRFRRQRNQPAITSRRSGDGKAVIYTVVTSRGTATMTVPVGSLALPSPSGPEGARTQDVEPSRA